MNEQEQVVLPERDTDLFRHIERNPGIRYRELLRLTGLANGVLSYHLAELERCKVIFTERQPRQTRFFPTTISDKESAILKHLRNKPERQIILLLLEHQMCTFNELVCYTGKAQSTVSGHLKKLRESAVVSVRYGEYCNSYSLTNTEGFAEMLSKYKASFADMIVDNYTEIIDRL